MYNFTNCEKDNILKNWMSQLSESLHITLTKISNNSNKSLTAANVTAEILYTQLHLHGINYDSNPLNLPGSILKEILINTDNYETKGWKIVATNNQHQELIRDQVRITVNFDDSRVIYSEDKNNVSVLKPRKIFSALPGWDRLVGKHGIPKHSNVRFYLPSINNPTVAADLVDALDAQGIQWHMKFSRGTQNQRPDCVVLYTNDDQIKILFASLLSFKNFSNYNESKLPGFSIPISPGIGIGVMQKHSHTQSYGWIVSNCLATAVNSLYEKQLNTDLEEISTKAIKHVASKMLEGESDAQFPW